MRTCISLIKAITLINDLNIALEHVTQSVFKISDEMYPQVEASSGQEQSYIRSA